jgi:sulfonate transport system substrate-binding protein
VYAALASDRIAAWVVWDPFTAQAEQQLGARVLANGKGVANGLSLQMASRDALADPRRNSAIADLMARNVRAHLWSKAHPEQWARAYSRESGLPYPVALASARRSDDEPITLSPQVVASEQSLADVLAGAKVIPRRPVIADIVDDRYSQVVTDARARS